LRGKKAPASDGGTGGRYSKQIDLADPLELPGKLPIAKAPWWADPQALRRATEGAVLLLFVALLVLFGGTLYVRVTELACRRSCRGNLHAIAIALQLYSQDHDGCLPPPEGDFARQMFTYVPGIQILQCPSDDLVRVARRSQRLQVPISYTYQGPTAANVDLSLDASSTVVAWDRDGGIPRGAHQQGGNLLFLDSHTRWWPRDLWVAADRPF